MIPPFEEALDQLLDTYADHGTLDEKISALELKLMALREQEAHEANEDSALRQMP